MSSCVTSPKELKTYRPVAMRAALSAYLASFIGNISEDMESERERLQGRRDARQAAGLQLGFGVVGIIAACIASFAACCYGFRALRTRLNECEREVKVTSLSTPGPAQSSPASCSAAMGAAQAEAQTVQHAEASTGTGVACEMSAVPAKGEQEGKSQAASNPTDPPPPCFSPA